MVKDHSRERKLAAISWATSFQLGRKGRKSYLMKHSTHFIYGYNMVYIGKGPLRGNLLLPVHGVLFLISSKGYFICTILQTGALAGMRNNLSLLSLRD